jgi:predicted transcriptional regulator
MLNVLEADQIPLNNIDDLQALPPRMDLFYRITFERVFPDIDTYEHTRSILGVMCEAMEPLGLIELAAIIGCDLKQIRTSLKPLQTLLIQKNSTTDNKTIVSFEHVSLSQWLSDVDEGNETPKAYPYEADRKQAKEMIRIWALAEAQKGQAHKWSYLARHLSHHLIDNERPAIISKLLKEFDWIQARLQHTNINTLLDDFLIDGIIIDHDPVLTLLQQALKQSKQLLMEEPNQLAAQLLGLLDPHSKFKEIQAICYAAKQWNNVYGSN